jgi:hypothetical protein
MPARDWRGAIGVLLLSATRLLASSQLEADPHDLYEAARGHLRNGELQAAESAIARLRGLVAPGSRWDPDGVFAKELLPPLSARLRRMQAAARALDAFCAGALGDPRSPDKDPDATALSQYADRAASRIKGLREKRDRILTERLASPEERAALTRTPSYACTERLLETDVLKNLEALPDDLPGAVSADPRVDPVLVRFRQLKRDLMKIVAERDQLRQDAKASEEREEAFLKALADITTQGALPGPPSGGAGASTVSDLFGSFLDRELNSAQLRTSQTSPEREARRADLGRYRRYNALIVQSSLGPDQSERIDVLGKAVEETPIDDRSPTRPARSAWALCLLSAFLGLVAGISTMLALPRGRISSRGSPARPPVSIHDAEARRSDVRDHAA